MGIAIGKRSIESDISKLHDAHGPLVRLRVDFKKLKSSKINNTVST